MKAIGTGGKVVARAARKDQLPSSMGFDRAWRPLGGYGGPGTPQQAIKAINTYGGTDQASATVFACVTLIADTLSSYEWGITDFEGDELQPTAADQMLFNLFDEPWPEATFTDFSGDVQTDLELVGNSYWLKDQQNALNQPLALKRLDPANVVIQTNRMDEKIGYRYRIKGIDIPFGLEDIVHYKTRNPLNAHYGMGTVEALLREIEADLAQNAHVTAFFTNGARIAGVLTIPDGLDEVQFERLKDELNSEYGDPRNAYKMLIAEKSTDFKAVTTDPKAAGVVELRRLAKDDILKGFGTPEFLLGGIAQAGIPKMEQSQFVFYRRMLTKAQRFQDRTSISIASRWEGRKFALYPELNEPPEQKIAHAKGLTEVGGTMNESRVAGGLPEIDDPNADIPIILLLQMLKSAASGTQPRPRTQVEPTPDETVDPTQIDEGEEADEPTAADAALLAQFAMKAPRKRVRRTQRRNGALKAAPGAGPAFTLDESVAALMTPEARAIYDVDSTANEITWAQCATSEAALMQAQLREAEANLLFGQIDAHATPRTLALPPASDLAWPFLQGSLRQTTINKDAPKLWTAELAPPLPPSLRTADPEDLKLLIEAPELPPGYEQRAPLVDPGDAPVAVAQQLLLGQATFFQLATPQMYAAFVRFFNDQRLRIVRDLTNFKSKGARANGRKGEELNRDNIWTAAAENEALLAAYYEIIDTLGDAALDTPAALVSANISWDVEYDFVKSARDALGEKVVRINETTRQAIGDIVELGLQRGYSIPQIANGKADENFKGIHGVFNDASAARSETIARTETGNLFNLSSAASYRTAGVTHVYIIDGLGDAPCAEASGAVWTVEEFESDPLSHPNCVRCAAPKVD